MASQSWNWNTYKVLETKPLLNCHIDELTFRYLSKPNQAHVSYCNQTNIDMDFVAISKIVQYYTTVEKIYFYLYKHFDQKFGA